MPIFWGPILKQKEVNILYVTLFMMLLILLMLISVIPYCLLVHTSAYQFT